MIDLQTIATRYPECLADTGKLRAFLDDLYPDEKPALKKVLAAIMAQPIFAVMQQGEKPDDLKIGNCVKWLEENEGFSPKLVHEGLQLWQGALCKKTQPEKVASRPLPKNAHSERKPPVAMSKPTISESAVRGLKIENGIVTGIGACTDQDIVIPEGVTSIGYRAFIQCAKMTSITLPDSVISIGDYAFWSCINLRHVNFSEGVVSIGNNAFGSCGHLTEVTIPDSVLNIGWRAFAACAELTSVTIPSSITNIQKYTFSDCPKLARIIFQGTMQQWRSIAKEANWDSDTGQYDLFVDAGQTLVSPEADMSAPVAWDDTQIIRVAGVTHGNRQQQIAKLKVGDPLFLVPDPHNAYDPHAVQVLTADCVPIGYIPKEQNTIIFENLTKGNAQYRASVGAIVGGGDYNLGVRMKVTGLHQRKPSISTNSRRSTSDVEPYYEPYIPNVVEEDDAYDYYNDEDTSGEWDYDQNSEGEWDYGE